MSVPFGERGGALRGVIDLVCGRLPRFVFGGPVGPLVPVFHFHDECRQSLEPTFRYLHDNGYRTITADELAAVARRRRQPTDHEVALCFDDAWATVWTDAAPLLRQYGLRAIVYAIPGRVADTPHPREVAPDAAAGGSPFMSWPELRSVHSEGIVDVQSHTWTHARIFTASEVVDFVQPDFARRPPLNRPLLTTEGDVPRFVHPRELGAPLYEQRSRMSDGPQVRVSVEAHEACVAFVRANGGASFFEQRHWRPQLGVIAARHSDGAGAIESDDQQRRAIEEELDRSRSVLHARLGTNSVRHVCFPWGVSGAIALDALKRLGFESAIANRWEGLFAVRPGDDPFWLKRLPNRYVTALPGRGRRTILSRAVSRLFSAGRP
jgi:peptidoglycan/xylan/chitin deacetylase (PgdA/CDA1 family)